MRLRSVLIVLLLLALLGLAVLNLGELLAPSRLNLGWTTVQAPLALLLALALALAPVLAWASMAYDTHLRRKERHDAELELQAQRRLADQAEGSRLAEVQRHLDLQAQASQHREREMVEHLDDRLDGLQRSVQRQIDDMGNTLAAYIGEVEDRLERRHLLRSQEDEGGEPPYPPSAPYPPPR